MIRRGLSILLTLALVLALALSAGAAGTPTVRIETPENVKAGESFEVRIVIENNPGLSAIQFTVSYDQKSLRCDECNTGSILSGTLSATNASGEDGAVLAAASVSPVKADGALGVLKFTALSDGKPSFRLTDTVFAGSDAKEVDVTVASGSTSQQPDKSGETGDKTFTDTAGSFAEDAIEEAADLGLILGYEGKYRPADAMTRGECVTILYRAMGSPKVEKAATFTDLTHQYYRDAIAWAEQNGVVNGVGNGKFNPGGSVTRAQLATILYRMAGSEQASDARGSRTLARAPPAQLTVKMPSSSESMFRSRRAVSGETSRPAAPSMPTSSSTVKTASMRGWRSVLSSIAASAIAMAMPSSPPSVVPRA